MQGKKFYLRWLKIMCPWMGVMTNSIGFVEQLIHKLNNLELPSMDDSLPFPIELSNVVPTELPPKRISNNSRESGFNFAMFSYQQRQWFLVFRIVFRPNSCHQHHDWILSQNHLADCCLQFNDPSTKFVNPRMKDPSTTVLTWLPWSTVCALHLHSKTL